MVEWFVAYLQGPHGRYLSELYLENQLFVNTIVVGAAIWKLSINKRKEAGQTTAEAQEEETLESRKNI